MITFKQYLEEQDASKKLTVVFGRFNPPTTGHEKLLDAAKKISSGGDLKIYASQSQDAKKNPLGYEEKIKFMRKMFPRYSREIILDSNINNLFDIAVKAYKYGYSEFVVVAGSDRVKAFDAMLSKYNGVEAKHGLYDFNSLTIKSAGERDPDADDITGMSASKMRAFVKDNDLQGFTTGLPNSYRSSAAKLFKAVQAGMGLKESNNFRKHIQFESVSEIREKYIEGNYLQKGMKVKADDQILEVKYLGSNYVILENNKRYWIEDITVFEAEEGSNIEGLKNKAEKSGISYSILKKVYDRGMAAWKSSHRPGTTPQQWAFARVNSFISGGKTQKTADADLWKKTKK